MRAERRVAEAALEAARAQLARIEQERSKLADQLGALGDGSEQVAARDEAHAKAEAAAQALADAEARRTEAEQGRAEAADRRDAAETALAQARAGLSAAKSEHDALARALEQGGGAAMASLSAEPGYERALAAALGEDADAAVGSEGPRRWQGSEALASDPALPAGHRLPRRPCHRAARAAAPAEAGRGCRPGRWAAARGRPTAGHARRRASPLGRLRRDGCRCRRSRAAAPRQPAGRAFAQPARSRENGRRDAVGAGFGAWRNGPLPGRRRRSPARRAGR